ncbi:AraC family transcriptional regulator [Cnuella takakiae]|uniref:AraC family transcriptional regulator n=1 Tax=Cnuella takakiae TaxID=1302690 RepID=UPI000934F3A9|nr:AraC family transcriptional regulator [Cnuella takakiae]OLY94988.1 AraC family transcriptional regulator [Cnuella takakiae]
MAQKNTLRPVALTPSQNLQTLVENRRIFNLHNCELNVFESYREAYDVALTFPDFVITSMVRGKKVMHLAEAPAFDYLPGESVIVPAHQTMLIDFPEASEANPTQCIALAVDESYIRSTIEYLNQYYNSDPDSKTQWQLHCNKFHFDNDEEVTALINKLIRICSSTDKAKNVYADLNLKELLIRLIQSQHLEQVRNDMQSGDNASRLQYVMRYIHEHLTDKILVDQLCRKAYLSRNHFFKWFREQVGITPLEYIINERIKLAKQLLSNPRLSLAEISQQCGFSDVNYFVRLFRKVEGITPGSYQKMQWLG